MSESRLLEKPLILLTGPPSARGFGISTHIRMLQATALSDSYTLEQVELGGASWSSRALTRAKRILSQLVGFRRQVKDKRPSIVHINSAPDTKAFLRDAAALWLVPARGARTVFEFHGGFDRNTMLQGPGWVRAFAKRTLRRASLVVTLNQYHTDALLRLCPGLPNVRAIPNFLEADMMSSLIASPIEAADGALRLLFISRVAREKGVFDAIETVRILHGRGRNISLRVAGIGDDLEEARSLAARYGLDGVIEFTGFIAGDDKVNAYLSSDVLLFPTYWNEGFPYVLLEAMAAGLPVISTTYGVMPHLMEDGVNGYLAEPGDPASLAEKVEKLILDPSLRIEIGTSNRRTVRERYGVEDAAHAYGQIYDELLRVSTRA